MRETRIAAEIERLGSLPTLPALAAEIGRTAADPESSAADIARLVSSDPIFAARVLKIANSPFFRPSLDALTDIHAAVVMLGLNAVKAIAVGLGLCCGVGAQASKTGFDRKGFLRHSLATGFGARAAAKGLAASDPETAFLAGLLHDIGKPVLDSLDPRKFKRVVRALSVTRLPFHEVEKGILGFNHADLGHEAAKVWGLPEEIAQAIQLHHRDGLTWSAEGGLARCVQCGDAVAQQIGVSFPRSHHVCGPEREIAARTAGVPPESIHQIERAVSHGLAEIEDLLGVFDDSSPRAAA
jgi:putative nucleotidyltransferase with HDIG domain